MSEKKSHCPKCGSLLPRDAPRGLCPECLLRGGFESADAAEPSQSDGGRRERPIHMAVPVDEPGGGVPKTLRYFGDYELLEQIAAGGMGVVFKARQLSLNRLVAVKMIRAGHLAREADIRRFRTEAEAAAKLKHPQIVAIHEVGEHQGRHFFSMDFIEGRSLAELVRDRPMEPARAARLVQIVAEAIAYAHERGVLHRDLKPSNVLIDAQDQPHVADFGLAKMLKGDSELTHTGAVMGSPSYMSPEQAQGRGDQVSVRSDVYALGAMLYELLTARPPFLAATPLETMKLVAEREPVAPGVLNPSAPRDLETICLKCLQKEPAHRYASAKALAEDLARWQRHEPIAARPSTAWERGFKWARRHPARAGLAALSLAVPAVIIALLLFDERRVARQRDRALTNEVFALSEARRATVEARHADDARAETRQNLYAADMLLAQHALDDGNLRLARRLVLAWKPVAAGVSPAVEGGILPPGLGSYVSSAYRASASNPPGGTLGSTAGGTPAATSLDLRGFEWRYLWKRCQGDELHTLHGHSNGVDSVAFSRDGKMLASGDQAGRVKLWDVATRRALATLITSKDPIVKISFSADGSALATANKVGKVWVWNVATRKVVWSHVGRNPLGVQLSPLGTLIGFGRGVVGNDANSAACVVDWMTGEEKLRVAASADFEAFSADGKRAFVSRGGGKQAELWDLDTRHVVKTIPEWNGGLVPSPDGKSFAAIWRARGGIFLFDVEGDKAPIVLSGNDAWNVAFSPDGTHLAAADSDQLLHVWDLATRREVPPMLGHVDQVNDVAFSPDGTLLATASADHTVKLWPAKRWNDSEIIDDACGPYALSPNGQILAGSDRFGTGSRIMIWDLASHQSTALSKPGESLVPEFFSADSQTLFARGKLGSNGTLPLLRWDMRAPGQPPETTLLEFKSAQEFLHSAASPDGSLYAVSQRRSEGISLWNPFTGEAVGLFQDRSVQWGIGDPWRFSPDGRKLVSLTWPRHLRLFDLATPNRVAATNQPPTQVRHLAFSPDGQTLALVCSDDTIRVWDSATFKETATLTGHQSAVWAVAFSPDGRTLASAGNGALKLWCLAAKREAATLFKRAETLTWLSFTPDGNTLLAGGWGGRIYIWRAPTLAEIDHRP